MLDVFLQYGLFLAKTITFVIAFWVIIVLIVSATRKGREDGHLQIKRLNEKYTAMSHALKHAMLSKNHLKQFLKEEKARLKALKKPKKETADRKRVFVLNFHGNIKATDVASLREEITAILTVATENDEVVVRLDNAGGLVHEHGLAASQLRRIRDRNIPLTVTVDKVAASGGYMMACVANRIIAAPFAILGSIGVLAQLPNFNRLIERHGIDFEQMKAGELKRTLTMFGKNTDEDRAHFAQQLEETHTLFKDFVADNRPQLEMEKIATGEHWYGKQAIDLNLVDELMTSDDYLLQASDDSDLYELSYTAPKKISEKLSSAVQLAIGKLVFSWWYRIQQDHVSR